MKKAIKPGDDFTENKTFWRWLVSGSQIMMLLGMVFFALVAASPWISGDTDHEIPICVVGVFMVWLMHDLARSLYKSMQEGEPWKIKF